MPEPSSRRWEASPGLRRPDPPLHSRAVGVRPPLVAWLLLGVSALIALAAIIAPEARARPRDSGVVYSCVPTRGTHVVLVRTGPGRCTTGQLEVDWRQDDVRGRVDIYGCVRRNGTLLLYEANVACPSGASKLVWRGSLGGGQFEDVHACVKRKTHVAQVVFALMPCARSAFRRSWPQILTVTSTGAPGPPGPAGPTGPSGGQGPPGPGDLRGHPVRLDPPARPVPTAQPARPALSARRALKARKGFRGRQALKGRSVIRGRRGDRCAGSAGDPGSDRPAGADW